jgi:hypothetical protein
MSLVCDTTGQVCAECNHDVDCAAGQSCGTDHTCVTGRDAAAGDGGADAAATSTDAATDAAVTPADAGTDAPTDAVGVDVGVIDCDPSTLGNLFAWFVADSAVVGSTGVTSWTSQAGTAGTLSGSGPQLVPNAINGHAAIDFSTGSLAQNCGPCPAVGSTVYAAVVYRIDAPASPGALNLFYQASSAGNDYGMSAHTADGAYDWLIASTTGMQAVQVTPAESPEGTPHLGTFLASGNGHFTVAVDRRSGGGVSDSNLQNFLASGRIHAGPFHGAIAEIIITGSPLAADLDCIDRHLAERYGIP